MRNSNNLRIVTKLFLRKAKKSLDFLKNQFMLHAVKQFASQ
jgi:hypothetical protein